MRRAARKAVKSEVDAATEELRKNNPNLRVTINPATGLPSSVSGLAPQPGSASLGAAQGGGELTEEETRRAVENYFGQGGLGSMFPTKNKKATQQYVGRRKDPDFPDRYIAEVEQRVEGVPVFGSSAKLTVERSLGVTKYSGTTSNVAIDDTKPKIDEASRHRRGARQAHGRHPHGARCVAGVPAVTRSRRRRRPRAQLVVFDPALIGRAKKGGTRLAWMVSIDAFRIFVDANSGEAFYYYRDQPSGMLRRVYDLAQATAFPGTKGIDEETRERAEGISPEALSSRSATPASCATTSSCISAATATTTTTAAGRSAGRCSKPTCATGGRRMPTGARPNPTTAPRAT